MILGTPPAEWIINATLIRHLLETQYPCLASESITLLDTGWDNMMYRVGAEHVVRVPRRSESAPLIVHEQTWLSHLANQLPIQISAPVYCGTACDEFPWRWSVLPWLQGVTANHASLNDEQPQRLAGFLKALHRPAPDSAPKNDYRGIPLECRASSTFARLKQLEEQGHAVSEKVHQVWNDALAAPEATEKRWLHGDLHARNILVVNGQISAIIDWGDITSGDVATDLSSIWMLFDSPEARAECLEHYGATETQIARAKGWSVSIAIALLLSGLVDHPLHAEMGNAALQRIEQT